MVDLTDSGLVDDGAIPPDTFFDAIDRTGEVAKHRLQIPPDLMVRLELEAEDLLIPRETLIGAAAGLISGNIILQGPPGTGKSSLASALARAFGAKIAQATAREDWTTFDVIGGQEIVVNSEGAERLTPAHGAFTAAVIDCAGSVSQNLDDADLNPYQATWLIIDELNRANMDRAFGELFTVLGTDELVPFKLKYIGGSSPELTTSRRFRIIGTMNSIDKQFVNSLSLAIRRRFNFITVDVPPQRNSGEDWNQPSTEDSSLAVFEFDRIVEKASRSLNASQIPDGLAELIRPPLARLLLEVEKVRYATESSPFPFLPIGTAPLIDVAQLALVRHSMSVDSDLETSFDWACSVKLAPLFETDLESPEKLRAFADSSRIAFPQFARELSRIEASGLYFVP
ncbi:AAA family ATPase [Cryobacterium sp. TmT2-59]|uniref:AAA family ATPase n=1 Tax=Cryobacterium sp. TmT2-59 TaxID=1259264 RepID=UPI0010695F91|nr:AAA family ATPase [Cryobacterium sp. TmT2-59]TFC87153.1 AAA family ATPase [Cryobacterium sp. TmT2-59]